MDQQFGPWIWAPLFNLTKKAFVEVKGYDTMNYGMEGLMTFQGTRVVHNALEPHSSLNNLTTPFAFHINSDDDMMNPPEGGSMEDAVNGSSVVRNSTMLLEDSTHAAEESLSFEE